MGPPVSGEQLSMQVFSRRGWARTRSCAQYVVAGGELPTVRNSNTPENASFSPYWGWDVIDSDTWAG